MVILDTDTYLPKAHLGGPAGRGRAALVRGRGLRGATPALRVAARHLIPLLVAVFVVNLALTQRRGFEEAVLALKGAQCLWLPVLLAASGATYVMAALVLSAASRHRLRFGRTVAVQVASSFTNRLAPGGVGGMATNVRYLERSGQHRADAVSAVGISWAAGVIVHLCVVVAVGLLFWFGAGHAYHPDLPPARYWPVVAGVAVLLSAAGLVAWRYLRGPLAALVGRVRVNVADLRRRPRDVCRLVAGSAGMTVCHMCAVVVSVQAFGGGVPLLSVALAYLAATGVAAAIPTPGGVGTLETALAAALVHMGAAGAAAIAAVLTYRLATFWLPLLPGAVTFRSLRRRRIL